MKISNGMKKRLLKFSAIFSLTFLPALAYAEVTISGAGGSCAGVPNAIGELLCNIQQLLNSIVPILITIGVVYFVWGIVQFFIADSEEAKTKGKDKLIYGIIGFAVIIGVWGLVNIVVNTFGFDQGDLYAPALAPIQTPGDEGLCTMRENFQGLLNFGVCLINNSIIPLIFAVAILMFIWGAVKFFIINSDEEAKREQGKQFMIWGIIALTVMTTVWGLVALLGGTFGIGGDILPQVAPPGSSSQYQGPCPNGSIIRSDGTCP
ncbi:hypothetical protein HYW73_02650 [Candidatus Nomurabacteria bacterium]|nr:hypothetical protein [Candidatus Nomurabacteria bacterium]